MSNLTKTEILILSMHASYKSTKAISRASGLTCNQVIVASYLLRKKLNISPIESLREAAKLILEGK